MFYLHVAFYHSDYRSNNWTKDSGAETIDAVLCRKDEIIKKSGHDAALHFKITYEKDGLVYFVITEEGIGYYEEEQEEARRQKIIRVFHEALYENVRLCELAGLKR